MKHKSLEMKYFVSCVAFNLLLLANIVSSQVLIDTTPYEYNITDPNGQKVQFYELKTALHLSCNLTDKSLKLEWRRDDVKLSEISSLNGRTHYSGGKLTIDKAEEDDSGNYSCVAISDGNVKESISITTSAKPAMKLPTNINVVEEDKLIIICTVRAYPHPNVSWKIGNKSINSSDERIKYETDPATNINNTILTIEDVRLSDRDIYTCTAKSFYSDLVFKEREVTIRVKDKLAALWPFLGICAEVLVLCAIILIYEKKRNKSELEESDTDQSPDQKNTPDHGKDSDVRQRK